MVIDLFSMKLVYACHLLFKILFYQSKCLDHFVKFWLLRFFSGFWGSFMLDSVVFYCLVVCFSLIHLDCWFPLIHSDCGYFDCSEFPLSIIGYSAEFRLGLQIHILRTGVFSSSSTWLPQGLYLHLGRKPPRI